MVQALKIKKKYRDSLDIAVRYYSILSILNDFRLTPLEVSLISFAAVRGSISKGGAKEQFCEWFKTTPSSLNNSISKLSKKRFLVKADGRTKINPQLFLDFNNDLVIQLIIENEASKQVS